MQWKKLTLFDVREGSIKNERRKLNLLNFEIKATGFNGEKFLNFKKLEMPSKKVTKAVVQVAKSYKSRCKQ